MLLFSSELHCKQFVWVVIECKGPGVAGFADIKRFFELLFFVLCQNIS